MKEYIFDEKKHIEEMMDDGYVDVDNPTNTIRKLARYNYYVNNFGKVKNYNSIVEYMSKNYKDFSEYTYQRDIDGCIKDVKKTPFKNILSINITKTEIEFIQMLDDIKKQKIAFVLLCTAKYRDSYNENNNHKTDISMTDLYKMARVVLPQSERAIFLHFLTQDNIIAQHTFAGVKNKKILFVSEDENDQVVIVLHEIDFLELAYVYLDYINGNIGYGRCEECGRMIKYGKTKHNKYCEECAKTIEIKNSKERVKKFREKM